MKINPFSFALLFGCLVSCNPLAYEESGYNTDNVEIVRDDFGVPHIFGKTDPDVAYGLAWAHAEDDFETIQLTLLAGKGMVGRYAGKDGAAVDYFVNLLETREIAKRKFEEDFSADFKALVRAYLAGMNDFALKNPSRVLLNQAFPATEIDLISAYILSLAQMSGADDAVRKIITNEIEENDKDESPAGSNAIAIHPSRTVSGEAFLAINSHQPLTGPVAWYEAHLHSEQGWNILGGLFPGGLTIFHGVNENLGWAHTVNFPDKLDVFKLTLNPENENQYQVDGKWVDLERRRVWLWVKFLNFITVPVPKYVWKSIFGPTLVTDHGVYSIRTGSLEVITAPEQWYKMNKARNYTEFEAAMSMMALPGFNTVYADKNDTIYFVSNALLPVRKSEYDYRSVLSGDSEDKKWDSYYSFKDLPQQLNPASGYLYNTNHSPFKASGVTDNIKAEAYPAGMGYLLTDNNRSLRFREIMPDTGKISYEMFKRIKFDKTLPDSLVYAMDINLLFALDAAAYPDLKDEIELLKSWNRDASAHSRGAALFAQCYYYFRDHTREAGLDSERKLTEEEAIQAIRNGKIILAQQGTTLGDMQKLVRGEKALPLFGVPDVISAMRSEPHADGYRSGVQGESYIMLVKFGKDLPEIETVNVYGASNQADSPHFADQMELFLKQELKPMSLDKTEVYKNAKRVYHPNRQ
jgi:acyl-homoserine-lactone acylase